MNNNNDAIRQENKKALPKFIAIVALSLVFGGVLGAALVRLNLEGFGDALTAAGQFFTAKVAGWLLIALPVAEMAASLPIYFRAKKQLAGWDGEDEAVSGEVEAKLSVCLWITGLATVAAFFLLAALFSGLVAMAGNPMQVAPFLFFGGLAAFLAALFAPMILQQKLVDLTKRLYPEKQGSVYDTKFQKKWYESCDEAERAVIGQCALKAYQATSKTCLLLWVVFALGGMFFSWGFLPAMTVCVIWGVNQSVYSWWAMKLARPGTAL